MKKLTAAGGIAVAAVALGLALAGRIGHHDRGDHHGGDQRDDDHVGASVGGQLHDRRLHQGQRHSGDTGQARRPGSPTIDLPFPPGWEDAGARTPQWAYVMMRYAAPAMAGNPPTITAIVSKLTGNVDPAKILEFAPGELRNLPGFEGEGGNTSTLAGFDAYEIDGFYTRDGAKHMVAQKTVVIPGQDGLYVLQLNPDGLEDQMGPLMDAMAAIDDRPRSRPDGSRPRYLRGGGHLLGRGSHTGIAFELLGGLQRDHLGAGDHLDSCRAGGHDQRGFRRQGHHVKHGVRLGDCRVVEWPAVLVGTAAMPTGVTFTITGAVREPTSRA